MLSLLLSEPFIQARSKKVFAESSFAIENRVVTAWTKGAEADKNELDVKWGEEAFTAV